MFFTLFVSLCLKMAEEEETREVLFPDWEGPDKTGLTIEQTTEGEIFVKEVKGESPAARSGRVHEGSKYYYHSAQINVFHHLKISSSQQHAVSLASLTDRTLLFPFVL